MMQNGLEYLPILQQVRKEWTAEKWCYGNFCEDAEGKIDGAYVHHPQAVRWCVAGYLSKVVDLSHGWDIFDLPLWEFLEQYVPNNEQGVSLADVSNAGHVGAIRVIDAAIADLEQQRDAALMQEP